MGSTSPALLVGVVAVVVAHLRLLYGPPVFRPTVRRAATVAGTRSAAGARQVVAHPIATLAAIGVLIGSAWAATYWRLVNGDASVTVLGINDYPLHLESARDLSLVPFHLNVPEFLFHLAAKAGEVTVGMRAGPVVALVAFTATAYVGVVLVFLERSRTDDRVLTWTQAKALGAAYFFMETPVLILLALHAVPQTTPFATVHWWGNPTFLASLPFTFLALPLIERAIDASEDPDPGAWSASGARVGMATVLVLGSAAKPSFTLMLLPALPVYLLAVRKVHRRTFFRMCAWALVPTALVVAWQAWFLGTGQSGEFRSGWVFDPIVEPLYGWRNMGPVFWFPLALLVLAVWTSKGRLVRERSVQLVLLALAVALPLMLTVRETGNKSGEGNMAVPAQACVAALLVLAIRTIAWDVLGAWERRRTTGAGMPVSSWVAGFVVGALLLGGALSLLDGSGLIHVPAHWELPYQGT